MQQRVITIVLSSALALSLLMLVSGMSAWRLPDREQGYSPEQPIAYSHRLHAGKLKIDCQFCHWAAGQGRHAGIPASDVCMKCHQNVKQLFDKVQARLNAEENAAENADENTAENVVDNITADNKEENTTVAVTEEKEIPSLYSDELIALYNSLALDYESPTLNGQMPSIPGQEPKSIEWLQIHNLPDFVSFDHRAHVNAGILCQYCHGQVETMERMRQFESLSMGWCVNCHHDANKNGIRGKQVNAPTGCAACHH